MGNSSSTASSSTTTTTTGGEKHDVFFSFRGEDTRNGFTSHLYQALHEKQIKTFIDDQLVRGEEISEGLWSAIGESKISVVIFSENYASSKWCLRELAEIMKYEEMKNQIVIPVFYRVDPSHVRKQIGRYEAAFAKHDQNELEEEVRKWREALTRASNISGWDSSVARLESDFVRKIVRDIWNKLYNISPSYDFKGLVGIDKRIERVVSLLCLEVPDFRMIGIWGMGGMGKTTIADSVFQLVSHQFEKRTHFARCVREQSEKDSSGLFRLRDEILSKVLNIKNIKLDGPSIPQWIKEMLNQNKVLIVLDDVDNFTKLEILAGGLDRFGPGSRIILTTRDKQVLHNCGVEDHNMYKVEGLNRDEALQLFCNYAFKQNHPNKDFEVLSGEVVKISTNVPLAVKVFGSLLYTKSKQEWENAVDKFQRNINHEVFDVLKISYDGLDEEEKGLFLDIACFVKFDIEIDEVYFAPNLLSGREFSLSGLIDKSLVTVEDRCIKMHDLLREMGREIVHKESPNKPGDRSRLWRQEDVLPTLKHNNGITNAVQGILLNLHNIEDKGLISQAIEKMYNLRTLIIESPYTNGDLDYLPDELRYLHWKRYPLEVLPSRFNPVNLVELDLSYSNIKQLWEGKTRVPKLKRLKLYGCRNLIRIPDLSNIPSAESINLVFCGSLLEIHSSTECPKNLHSLQLSYCKSLSRFPSNIHIEGSEFSLQDCISLTKFPQISGNIKTLNLSGSGVEEVPSTILSLSKIERLDMVKCKRFKHISKRICKLKSLNLLDLTGCSKLEKLPPLSGLCSLKELRLNNSNLTEISEDIGCLSSLEKLELEGNVFERLPKSIKKLSKLCYLRISYCGMLRSLPELPSSLRYLDARNCKQLIQSLTDESEFVLCADGGGSLYFNFINCLKLNQKAISNLLIFFRDSILKMQLMGTEKILSLFKVSPLPFPLSFWLLQTSDKRDEEEVKGSICLPGSEIPEWFSCYKNIGSSINIPVLRNNCGRSRYIMGFAVCLVIGFVEKKVGLCFDVHYDFHTEISDGHKEGFFHESISVFGEPNSGEIGLDHIFLGYNLSRKCYEFFQELDTLLANRSMSDYVGTSFEFNIRSILRSGSAELAPLKGCEVKYCGIQPIYVQAHVMNSVSINQDTGDTSGRNDTVEETCEPHTLRICTEAKDSEGSIDDNSNFISNSSNCKETAIEDLDLELCLGHSSFNGASKKDCELKHCGIHPIYVRSQVMNSVAINQDTGDTSGSNNTEETCEPHPKRICTEANQCSLLRIKSILHDAVGL